MDHQEAKAFLQANQPVPVDSDYDQDAIDRLGEVLDWYRDNPVEADLPLLVGLVDEADQSGLFNYILRDLLFDRFDHASVIRLLDATVSNGPIGSAMWATDHLWNYVDHPAFLPACRNALASKYPEVRGKAAFNLGLRGVPSEDFPRIAQALARESDDRARHEMDEALNRLSPPTA